VSDLDKIKEGLQSIVDGEYNGIEIDTPLEWVIEGVKNPIAFFEHLPVLLPNDSVLYLEGTQITPEVETFYAAHRALDRVEVRRDTIFPEPKIYHVAFSADVSAALREIAENNRTEEMFDHIKGYRSETLLFSFHDAFDGWLRISDHIPSDNVAKFCEALGVPSRREKVQKVDPENARNVLFALENLERSHVPWFKRVWYWITGN
jgi:hypothetical protein